MAELSVPEAGQILGVNRARVHALLRAHELRGRKIGSRWLVDESSARARAAKPVAHGRPFSPPHAWAYLLLLSGENVPWLDPPSRSRIRARIRNMPVRDAIPRLRRRASPKHYRASARAIGELVNSPQFVLSGVSAAADVGASVVARDQADGYLGERLARELVYRLALVPSDPLSANVILRIPNYPAALRGRQVAPAGAVAVDLIESSDQRVQRAGDQLAERLRADRNQAR